MRLLRVAALLLVPSIIPSALPTRSVDSAAFVVRFGTDTLEMERWVRSADRLDPVSVTRAPRMTVRRYSLRFDADAASRAPPSATPSWRPFATPGDCRGKRNGCRSNDVAVTS